MATSQHKGIYYRSEPGRQKRWCARLMVNGKYHNIGNFLTEEEAIIAYKNFIEENKDTLPEKAKSLIKNREDFPRDENGYMSRTCLDCGKIDKFKRFSTKDRCKSCAIKESFRHRPAVGLKELDLESAYKDYQSGTSLKETGEKYGFSAGGLERKFKRNGYKTKTNQEAQLTSLKREETNAKISNTLIHIYDDIEERKKVSSRLQGIPIEKWSGFVSDENQIFYRSPEYKEWRKAILKRDDYTCALCQKRGGKLQSHHIRPKCKFPELKLEISNGICLCHGCHNITKNNEQNFEQFFLDLLCIK